MKNEDKFFNNSIYDEQAAAFSEKQLTDPMQYQEGMEIIDSDIFDKVQTARAAYDYNKYTEADVLAALAHSERCLLYTSPSPRDSTSSRMPSSA